MGNRPDSSAQSLYDRNRLYTVAVKYYEEQLSQSEIASQIGVSRPTISRMLATARETGMVQIRILPPEAREMQELEQRLCRALDLQRVYIAPGLQSMGRGTGLRTAVQRAVNNWDISPGDTIVIASGLATHTVALMGINGIEDAVLIPAVGGVNEPESWHQTNETVRLMAESSGAQRLSLFASVMPSPAVYEALSTDGAYNDIVRRWGTAKAAIVGVGSPTARRHSLASMIPQSLLKDSVGDVCLHFFDERGAELSFPGDSHTVRIPMADLKRIPHALAVAIGHEKIQSIQVAAQMGLFKELATDEDTAELLLEAVSQGRL